ncbi:Pentatricopeptide repeat-containing protein [Striga hermonthica]|uniref:Pentatricopeptide repeat-containing protein n=1 Tax=Striga hermonthica TaxID=68872 RepID=A0A9N7N5X0_STRHE|nr:Pentatricopeptide repeat-containing protein [Striga hermonthica]
MLIIRQQKLALSNNHGGSRFLSTVQSTAHEQIPQTLSNQAPTIAKGPAFSLLTKNEDPKLALSSLARCKNLSHLRQLHCQAIANGEIRGLFVATKLLRSYASEKDLESASAVFNEIERKTSFSWCAMINGYAKSYDYINCYATFREYIRSGDRPDCYTLPVVIKVCRKTEDLVMGRVLHCVVCKYGFNLYPVVAAVLMDMYAKGKAIMDAAQLFDEMPAKDMYAKGKAINWTLMIGAWIESGTPEKALDLFERMREEGVVPDKIALVNIVIACAKLRVMCKANLVGNYVSKSYFSLDVILGTALIDMYAKCGSISLARKIFDKMREKNVVSWSTMIAAYGYHGEGLKALNLFRVMLNNGVPPNSVTFVSLLYACCHSGLVDEGLELFSIMHEVYGVRRDVKHFTCVVDLLGRAGKLNLALNMIEQSSIDKDVGLWGALLGACRVHVDVDLAEVAAEHLFELQPQNTGHYVLLSNIYAKAGRREKVAEIREMMNRRKIKRVPGWTWIEVDNEIHRFSVGDFAHHPMSKEIYKELKNLSGKLEVEGYVPDTNVVLHDLDEELKLELLLSHSEKLAIAFGLIRTPDGSAILITKNLRVCGDCHTFIKFVSLVTRRVVIVRDANRCHHFEEGACSCGDYW